MRCQREFNYNPHQIFIKTPTKKIETHLCALMTLSKGITKLGLTAASGLRLISIFHNKEFLEFLMKPNKKIYLDFLMALRNLKKN